MNHELVQLTARSTGNFIDGEIAPLYRDSGRPGIATRFVIGLFLLKHLFGLSDEGVCERWLLAENLRVRTRVGHCGRKDLARVTIDTTVHKNTAFPIDAKLLHAAIKGLTDDVQNLSHN